MVSPSRGRWGTASPVQLGRFVVSDRRGAGPGFVLSHLFPPHGRRERWLRAAAERAVPLARWAFVAAGPQARRAGQALQDALAALGAAPWEEWVLALPHDNDLRGRWTAFLFPPGGREPDRVVKLRAAGPEGPSLAAEAGALERLGRALPETLARTLPAVLGHASEAGGQEVLILSRLPGRSGYVELQASFAPAALVAGHFQAAGAWLTTFHQATLRPEMPWTVPSWAELTPAPGDPRPAWHRRLAGELEAAPCPRAAGHGDFWVRNLLFDPGGSGALSGVVDWEHHRPLAPSFEDLFHFAWSYARAYPWRGRRCSPMEAFDRAFLRETVLSREIRRYLAGYARETGTQPGVLGELFRVFLLTRRRTEGDTWARLYERLERAERSVFSG